MRKSTSTRYNSERHGDYKLVLANSDVEEGIIIPADESGLGPSGNKSLEASLGVSTTGTYRRLGSEIGLLEPLSIPSYDLEAESAPDEFFVTQSDLSLVAMDTVIELYYLLNEPIAKCFKSLESIDKANLIEELAPVVIELMGHAYTQLTRYKSNDQSSETYRDYLFNDCLLYCHSTELKWLLTIAYTGKIGTIQSNLDYPGPEPEVRSSPLTEYTVDTLFIEDAAHMNTPLRLEEKYRWILDEKTILRISLTTRVSPAVAVLSRIDATLGFHPSTLISDNVTAIVGGCFCGRNLMNNSMDIFWNKDDFAALAQTPVSWTMEVWDGFIRLETPTSVIGPAIMCGLTDPILVFRDLKAAKSELVVSLGAMEAQPLLRGDFFVTYSNGTTLVLDPTANKYSYIQDPARYCRGYYDRDGLHLAITAMYQLSNTPAPVLGTRSSYMVPPVRQAMGRGTGDLMTFLGTTAGAFSTEEFIGSPDNPRMPRYRVTSSGTIGDIGEMPDWYEAILKGKRE